MEFLLLKRCVTSLFVKAYFSPIEKYDSVSIDLPSFSIKYSSKLLYKFSNFLIIFLLTKFLSAFFCAAFSISCISFQLNSELLCYLSKSSLFLFFSIISLTLEPSFILSPIILFYNPLIKLFSLPDYLKQDWYFWWNRFYFSLNSPCYLSLSNILYLMPFILVVSKAYII